MPLQQAGWVEKASADNAAATATKTGVTGKQYVVYGVHASFSAASTKLLQIKSGSTVVWEGYVANSLTVEFPAGLGLTPGDDAVAVLAASGAGGTIGKVALHGATF